MKKIISVIIVLCMLLAAVPMSAMASSVADYMNDPDWTAITNYQDLTKMEAGKNYYLAIDIVVPAPTDSATSYGTEIVEARGGKYVLDGCGNSITFAEGVKFAAQGVLFYQLATGSVIKNLTIGSEAAPVTVTSSKANIGVIASSSYGTSTIENVTVYANIDDSDRESTNNVGGIIGKHNGGTLTVKDCTFYGSINNTNEELTQGKYYGGIVGKHENGNLVITGCKNYATITDVTVGGGMNTPSACGGILGTIIITNKSVTVENCVNYGSVTSKNIVGGIVGRSTYKSTIKGCTNYGTLTQSSEAAEPFYAAGGIIGYVANTATLENCANFGEYSTKGQFAGKGGIDGTTEVGITNNVTACYSASSSDLAMIKGASVKYDAPTALRFRTIVSAAANYDAIVAVLGADNVKFGTRIAKLSDITEAGSFEALAEDKYTDVAQNGWYTKNADGSATFTGSTASIEASDYGTDYIGVGYISVKVGDTWVTSFAEYNAENARTVAEVSAAAIADRKTNMEMEYINKVDADSNYSPYTAE